MGKLWWGGVHNNIVEGQIAGWWAPGGGMVALDYLPGPGMNSCWAYGVSSDGSVIVGVSMYASYNTHYAAQATRWSLDGSMQGLGFIGGGQFSYAVAASSDGSVIVGFAKDTAGSQRQAFIWDHVNGMRSLKSVLEGYGWNLAGWYLNEAKDISDDGQTVVGFGTNPSGDTEGWIVTLP